MTDTTDIKALRELLCHENKESDHRVGVTVTTLRLLLSKSDQLEAERQQREVANKRESAARKGFDEQYQRAEAAEKERDEREQYWNSEYITLQETYFEECKENAELRAKLANPVVLPELCSVTEGEHADSPQILPDPDGYLCYSHKVIESIIIAGFTVKVE